MKSQKNMGFRNQLSVRLLLAFALVMTSLSMTGCAAKRTVSNSSSGSSTPASAHAPNADPIEEDVEPQERPLPPNTLSTSNLGTAGTPEDWKTATCAAGRGRDKWGRCKPISWCPKQCAWNLRAPDKRSCWTTLGQNVVVGYSDQTVDSLPCAWVKN